MPVRLHWFLPTSGDSRADGGLSDAVQAVSGTFAGHHGTRRREPSLDYLGQIARSAEQLGFEAVLTPTSSACADAWVTTAALVPTTERLKFLVAFRPGTLSPLLAAQLAATYQQISGGRLLLNVVTGGEDIEQRRYGDRLDKDARYARTAEFLDVLRRLFDGERVTHHGEHLWLEDAALDISPEPPEVYFGGSSAAAIEVAASYADVYLTWGEPLADVRAKLESVSRRAQLVGRRLRYGIRLHAIARPTAAEAWARAESLLAEVSDDQLACARHAQSAAQSEGQRRMTALHEGQLDRLLVAPNLWAGIGLVRGGAGTALVGSYAEVADRIAEYHEIGIDEFILSGYPHLEEAYHVGEGVRPELEARGLLESATRQPAIDRTSDCHPVISSSSDSPRMVSK
jgi:alkanesulfonate monooxygenase